MINVRLNVNVLDRGATEIRMTAFVDLRFIHCML